MWNLFNRKEYSFYVFMMKEKKKGLNHKDIIKKWLDLISHSTSPFLNFAEFDSSQ
jgi:hypothetical protein